MFISNLDFEWLNRKDHRQGYESSPGLLRCFCKTCGSSVPFECQLDQMGIPAGILDSDPGMTPQADIFTADRLPWYEIPDSAVAFPAKETAEFMAAYHQRSKQRYKRG